MIPVIQTVYGKGRGNCYSACFASLLEIGIDEVPCFVRDHGNRWYEAVQKWLGDRGMMTIRIVLGENLVFNPLPEDCLCIATGKSPRGEFAHSVVGKINGGFNFQITHDPHPDGRGIIGEPTIIEFLAPLNPKVLLSHKV